MTVGEKRQRERGAAPAASPLSLGQRAVWLRQQLAPGSPMHITARALRLRGALDRAALKRAVQALVARHAILAATFTVRDHEPEQVVRSGGAAPLSYEDAAQWTDARFRERLIAEAFRPLDLAQDPLFRLVLFGRGIEEHILLLVLHDLVADVQSLAILLPELAALYAAERTSGPAPFAAPATSYGAYVAWQEQVLSGSVGEQLRAYWRRQLAEAPPVLALPMAGERPVVPSYRGAVWTGSLGAPLSVALDELARRDGITLSTLLLTAFGVLLFRYTGQEDVVVGTTPAPPDHEPFGASVGYRADLLPLRADLTGDPSFRAAVRRVDMSLRGAQAHREYPLALLIEHLAPARVPGYAPLVQIAFQLYQAEARDLGDLTALLLGVAGPPLPWADLTLEPLALERPVTPLDLTLAMGSVDGELVASFAYSTDVFDAETIGRMGGHLRTLLQGIVAAPDQAIATLPLLPPAERELLAALGCGPAVQDVDGRLIHEIVQSQADRTPDAVAVEYGDLRLTYAEIDRRANRLAHTLQSLGVGNGVMVGLFLERSLDLPIAYLAILKASGAYVPLEPDLPRERLMVILEDTGTQVVLTRQHLREALGGFSGRILELDADAVVAATSAQSALPPRCAATGTSLLSVVYTSGSTGMPKGVECTHAAAASGCALFRMRPDPESAGSRVLLSHGVSDSTNAWLVGATLVILRDALRQDFEDLLRRIVDERITHLIFPGSALPSLADAAERTAIVPHGLRQILCGGTQARITPSVVRLFEQLPDCTLLCTYGASEVWFLAWYELTGPPAQWPEHPPLGRPVPGAEIYLLDDHLQPVPIGVYGQLYARTCCMARGYGHRPDLTAERFIPDPFSAAPGARIYRTGDVVRFRPDGMLEFMGRTDYQVKYRGYRVEPGEVEMALRTHPTVGEAVVLARTDGPGGHRLVAYVVAAPGQTPLGRELRAYLAARLPEYMVPATYCIMDRLPRLYNNKIDRRALPAPGPARPDVETPYVAPRTPAEELLAGIMAEVLGLERVGVDDSFFELGGHSLLGMRVVGRIRDALQVALPLRQLFATPTVAGLARAVSSLRVAPIPTITAPDELTPQRAAHLLAQLEHLSDADLDQVLAQLQEQEQRP